MSESIAFQFGFCLCLYEGASSKKFQSLNYEICCLKKKMEFVTYETWGKSKWNVDSSRKVPDTQKLLRQVLQGQFHARIDKGLQKSVVFCTTQPTFPLYLSPLRLPGCSFWCHSHLQLWNICPVCTQCFQSKNGDVDLFSRKFHWTWRLLSTPRTWERSNAYFQCARQERGGSQQGLT